MDEQRKYAILLATAILAARKLHEIGAKPCPARECAIADAIENAKRILESVGGFLAESLPPRIRLLGSPSVTLYGFLGTFTSCNIA